MFFHFHSLICLEMNESVFKQCVFSDKTYSLGTSNVREFSFDLSHSVISESLPGLGPHWWGTSVSAYRGLLRQNGTSSAGWLWRLGQNARVVQHRWEDWKRKVCFFHSSPQCKEFFYTSKFIGLPGWLCSHVTPSPQGKLAPDTWSQSALPC